MNTHFSEEPEASRLDAFDAALALLARNQHSGGSWKGDYGGPLFLLPMFVGTARIAGIPLDTQQRERMVTYLRNHQNDDGGWGLHVEGHSHVFTSVLCYVALRLLDVSATDPKLSESRAWFLARGGATASASWGKYFLAFLSLYEYEGLNPVLPEPWLLPEALPIHPSRLWCHCRAVYLPLSYLYATRRRTRLDRRLLEIRGEIYTTPYERVDWPRARRLVADEDSFVRRTPLLRAANHILSLYDRRPISALRRRSLAFVLDQIRAEDRNTDFICLGPISKLFHTLVWHFERPGGSEFEAHVERLGDYLYLGADGLKMQGYNSSELWDLAFACQAIVATGRASDHRSMLRAAYDYLDRTQVREDVPDGARYFRDRCRGGWPFSTRDHGWPITDCTAEGIKASLALESFVEQRIDRQRLQEAVELILFWQNDDGGWATYERTRGPRWLERFNPSDCFADIMIDYSHVECTSACMQALTAFVGRYPDAASEQIASAVKRGKRFLLARQCRDGSWEGSWGVCFTYGTWFGVLGLKAAGVDDAHAAIRHACAFLRERQLADGGWGETAESCRERRYVSTRRGQAVMTSWAMLALIAGGEGAGEAARRGETFLRRTQRPDGSWPEEHIAGMFNKTCAIHYDNYLKIFPMWALALAAAPAVTHPRTPL